MLMSTKDNITMATATNPQAQWTNEQMNVNPDGRWNPTNKTKQTQAATQEKDQKESGLT